MGLSIEEQETCINFSRNDGRARIYTSDSTMMTKLNKLIELPDADWKLENESRLQNGEIVGKTYSCPVGLISFRSKKSNRQYTEEEKQAIRERFTKKREIG